MEIKLDPTGEEPSPLAATPEHRLLLVAVLLIVFVLVTSTKLGKKSPKKDRERL